jgi:hypothetical protein
MAIERYENNIPLSPIKAVITLTGRNCGTLGQRFHVMYENDSFDTDQPKYKLAEFLNNSTGKVIGGGRLISEAVEASLFKDFKDVLEIDRGIYVYTGPEAPHPVRQAFLQSKNCKAPPPEDIKNDDAPPPTRVEFINSKFIAQLTDVQKRKLVENAFRQVMNRTSLDLRNASYFFNDPTIIKELISLLNEKAQNLFKLFEQFSSRIVWHARHGTSKKNNFDNIMSTGTLYSQNRIESILKRESGGLNSRFDKKYASEFFAFFSCSVSGTSFFMNFPMYVQINVNRLLEGKIIKHLGGLVLKSEDWGVKRARVIKIPGKDGIQIRVIFKDGTRAKDGHPHESSQQYQLADSEGNVMASYTWGILDEIAVGQKIPHLAPLMILRHMTELQRQGIDPCILLQALEEAGDDKRFQQEAVKTILHAFHPGMEMSMAEALPLMLEYVDEIKDTVSFSKPSINISILRESVERGELTAVEKFMNNYPQLNNFPWVLKGIHRIAKRKFDLYSNMLIQANGDNCNLTKCQEVLLKKAKYQAILNYIQPRYQRVIENEKEQLIIIPAEVTQIKDYLLPMTLGSINLQPDLFLRKNLDGIRQLELSELSSRQKIILRNTLNGYQIEENAQGVLCINLSGDGQQNIENVRNALLTNLLTTLLACVKARVNREGYIEITFNNKYGLANALQTGLIKGEVEENGDVLIIKESPYKVLGLWKSLLKEEVLHGVFEKSLFSSSINETVRALQCKKMKDQIINFLNNNKSRVLEVSQQCKSALQKVKNLSSLGLQATLKLHTVDNEAFRDLLSDKESCRILLYLSAVNYDWSKLDEGIVREVTTPLFQDQNSYTGNTYIGYFSGIAGRTGRVNRSILADILFNIPPVALLVPNKGYSSKLTQNQRLVGDSIDCYNHFFANIRELNEEFDVSCEARAAGEQFLTEKYDPRNWQVYKRRFQELAQIYSGVNMIDGCGNTLSAYKNVEQIISKRLVLLPEFSHFCLDPKHLQSIIGSNYGDYKSTFFALLDEVASHPTQNSTYCLAGEQLFYRLKLLEFELYKEYEVIKGSAGKHNSCYQHYRQEYLEPLTQNSAAQQNENSSEFSSPPGTVMCPASRQETVKLVHSFFGRSTRGIRDLEYSGPHPLDSQLKSL